MARKKHPPMGPEAPNWFIREWADALKMRPVDLVRETDIPPSTMSEIWNGKTDYYRWLVNEFSRAMNIEPFELLMHPDEAFALRRLRTDAIRIAADTRQPWRDHTGNLVRDDRKRGAR